MKIKYFFYIILLTTLLAGCNKDEKETVVLMTVDGETVWSYGEHSDPIEYMQTRETPSGEELRMVFSQIDGFTYEKGFEYLIKVKKTKSPIDKRQMGTIFLYHYSLVEIISKTEVDDGGTVVLLTVSAEMEWVYLNPEQSRLYPLFLLVKEADTDRWEQYPFYLIRNFNYESGFEYVLKVKKNNIEPSLQHIHYGQINYNLDRAYWLVEVISKTEKQEIIEN